YYNSASSQFFIVTETSENNSLSLDGNYAAFGRVLKGMDIVKAIAAVDTNESDKPLKTVTIATITSDLAVAKAAIGLS
ncbi:MAG: peptidylprolyl isomerase, partial [Clostridia bacterium]|nr:peptidylprolyl isomerase [Clostridia bacterium]